MSRLFIELYLDEDIDVLVADRVRARGFQATTTREAGQVGKGDGEQLAYAVSRDHLQTLAWDRMVADVRPFLEPGIDPGLLTRDNLMQVLKRGT